MRPATLCDVHEPIVVEVANVERAQNDRRIPRLLRHLVIELPAQPLETGERSLASFLWFNFESWRRKDEERPSDEREPELVTFQEKMSSTTDGQDSVEYRHKILLTRLLNAIPDLAPLDPQRSFTYEQRLAIFRRDKGVCQESLKCDGKKCDWDRWHADHKIAWSNGGKTTVENGQVTCIDCNLAKSDT